MSKPNDIVFVIYGQTGLIKAYYDMNLAVEKYREYSRLCPGIKLDTVEVVNK